METMTVSSFLLGSFNICNSTWDELSTIVMSADIIRVAQSPPVVSQAGVLGMIPQEPSVYVTLPSLSQITSRFGNKELFW